MTASLRAFLDGLMDYAGLFPPANLDMPEAIATYARHLDSDHAWMVGRFVCPVNQLAVFAAEGDEVLRRLGPIRVAGLASSGSDVPGFLDLAGPDAARTKVFEQEGWGLVDVLEVRLPDDLIDGDPEVIGLVLDRYEEELLSGGMRLERIYYEISRTHAWDDNVTRLATACSGVAHRGFKIRCGGLTPDAYPTVEQISDAITICKRFNVPFKATAGLHHPIRHELPESGITRHGFVNVFAAGLFASGADSDRLRSLIDDRRLDHFDFGEEQLSWNGHQVPLDALIALRESFAISYGSCDIDEPVEDLRTVGLL